MRQGSHVGRQAYLQLHLFSQALLAQVVEYLQCFLEIFISIFGVVAEGVDVPDCFVLFPYFDAILAIYFLLFFLNIIKNTRMSSNSSRDQSIFFRLRSADASVLCYFIARLSALPYVYYIIWYLFFRALTHSSFWESSLLMDASSSYIFMTYCCHSDSLLI